MESSERVSIFLRIALICLLLLLLGIFPVSRKVQHAFLAAREATANQQPAHAAAALRQVLAEQPTRVELWEQVGRLEYQAGDAQAAIFALETARQYASVSTGGLILLGDAYRQRGDAASALAVWQQVLVSDASAELYGRILAAQQNAGDLAAMQKTLTGWQALEPQNAALRYQIGLLNLLTDPDAALPLLLDASRLDPAYTPRVQALRNAVGLAGTSEDAAYRKVIMGRALGNVTEWTLALQLFEEAAALSPGYAEAWAFAGEARQNLGLDGLPELQKAAALDPDSVIVQGLFSVYWRRNGQPERALAALRAVMAQEPDEVIWLLETGNTQAESGDLIAALASFEEAARREPDNPSIWLALGRFCLAYEVDISGTGLPAARRALKLLPDSPPALDLMGSTLLQQGDLVSAERFLQRALQQDQGYAPAYLHLGQVYLQQNNLSLAFSPLRTAAQLDGTGGYGALARRLLDEFFPGWK